MEEVIDELGQEEVEEEDVRRGKYMTFQIGQDVFGIELKYVNEIIQMQPGDLIFYSFTSNGRYKNISHVAVYVGDGKVVEALNENSGVVYRDVASVGKIVVIGRP